jgi:hypothetical protein
VDKHNGGSRIEGDSHIELGGHAERVVEPPIILEISVPNPSVDGATIVLVERRVDKASH